MPYSFAAHLARYGPTADYPPMDLAQARSYCTRLTRSHYENFSVASILLPRRLLPHFHAVYAFCRWADDLGDETGGGQHALDLLARRRNKLLDLYVSKVRHPVLIALRATVKRFHIPAEPFLDLISAFEQDQRVKSYSTFVELLDYCRRSANPVGRLVLYLCECFNDQTAELSDSICTGLQLANFWQDVRRDWLDLGRLYLPEEDRRRFNIDDADLRSGRFTSNFRNLMKFEVDRARDFLERGRPLLELVPRDVRKDIRLFLEGGLAILRRIEVCGYDVLSARPEVSKWGKGRILVRAVVNTNSTSSTKHRTFSTQYSVRSTQSSFSYCQTLTQREAKNFRYAFLALPRAQRRAMEVLYAFMRITDDLADEVNELRDKSQALRQWRSALDRCLQGEHAHQIHPALDRVVQRYRIPPKHLHEVIEGVELDLNPVSIATFDELYAYCYRVASAVGLCCIHIWGFRDERAKEHAEAAGIAFQLTNILRDLGEDLEHGRVYLPREDIERFGCPPERWRDLDDDFKKLMRFQIERAREYYRRAEPLSSYLDRSGRAIFAVMMRIYRGLLDEIERRGYDVFRARVSLSRSTKLRHLLQAFPIRWGWQ